MEMKIGDIVEIVDVMGNNLTGLVLTKSKYNYERWGGGGRWFKVSVMVDGHVEEWRIGGTTGIPYRAKNPVPRRWCPNPFPKIVSRA